MSNVDQVVSVSIVASGAAPSLPGTDIPGFIGYHNFYTDRVRTYFDVAGMVADGFPATHPLCLMAASWVNQNPHGGQFKVIRGSNAIAQVLHFKVTDTQTGHTPGIDLVKPDGSVVATLRHTNTVGQTAAQIATALAATVIAGLTIAVDGGDNTMIDITVGTAGDIWYPQNLQGGDLFDVTPTAAPDADLDNALTVDGNFYGLAGTWLGATNIALLAAWAETNKRFHCYTTPETDNINTSNLGIFQTLKNAAYDFSIGWYSGTPATYLGVAIMSKDFVADPGSDTLAYKTVSGVPIDALTPTQIHNAGQFVDPPTKNGNVYIDLASTNNTVDGRMASGLYADIRRGIDALSRDIQVDQFGLIRRMPKVPFTRKGISALGGELKGTLGRYQETGFLSSDDGFTPVVMPPELSTISASDKAKRKLRKMGFTAVAQGAIQTVLIQGSLTY